MVQERPITCYYKAKGNIYVETQYDNVDTFRISRDGVYSVDVAIPADSGNVSGTILLYVICGKISLFYGPETD